MKKIFCFCLIIVLMLLCACQGDGSSDVPSNDDASVNSPSVTEREIEGLSEKLSSGYALNALLDEYAVLSRKKIPTEVYGYYLYRLDDASLIKEIGEIKNFYAASSDMVLVEDTLYWNVAVKEDEKYQNHNVSYNIKTDEFKVHQPESLYQIIVNTSSVSGMPLFLKSSVKGNEGNTYVEGFDTSAGQSKQLISKVGNIRDGSGEFIDVVCGFDQEIFIVNCKDAVWYLEIYNKNGEIISSVNIDEARKILNNEYISQFTVLDKKTVYIKNHSGDSVLLNIGGPTAKVQAQNPYDSPVFFARSAYADSQPKALFDTTAKTLYIINQEIYKVTSIVDSKSELYSVYTSKENVLILSVNSNNKKVAVLKSIDSLTKGANQRAVDFNEIKA